MSTGADAWAFVSTACTRPLMVLTCRASCQMLLDSLPGSSASGVVGVLGVDEPVELDERSLEWKRMCLKIALNARADGDCIARGWAVVDLVERVEMESGGRTAVHAEGALGRCSWGLGNASMACEI